MGAWAWMHDFGKIVYLDFQKTGSSFVSSFLRAACLHPETKLQKHVWIGDDYRADAIYFTTVRSPVMLYSSLFRFGLDRRGGIFRSIKSAGHLSVYESFETFCEFLLDEDNAEILHPFYSRAIAGEIGLMSFRHLLLSLQYPVRKISEASEQNMPLRDLLQQSIVSHVLRNESLNEELLKLSSETLPEHFDQRKAAAFLSESPRVNASSQVPESVSLGSDSLRREIEAKEALLLAYYS